MATVSDWIEGARPRTLPAAVAPVLAGSGLASYAASTVWWKAALALVVALALQVGVNFANDYSDGIRGTDAARVGPMRLVGSGAATPGQVRAAAFASFGVAAGAGFVLALTTAWWLLLVGALAIAAAWFYTGGATPYGYRGLGEVGVFVFFGVVAVVGTTFVQTDRIGAAEVVTGCGVGALACAILVVNNLRDIATDATVGKRTLAVVLGAARSRALFVGLHLGAFGCLLVVSAFTSAWALVGLVAVPLSVRAVIVVLGRAGGPALLPALRDTGLAELLYGLGVFIGLTLS